MVLLRQNHYAAAVVQPNSIRDTTQADRKISYSPFVTGAALALSLFRSSTQFCAAASVDVLRDKTQVDVEVPVGAEHPCETVSSERTVRI